MQSSAKTVKEYIAELPDDRKKVISKLRDSVHKNLPKGFSEIMAYGMISYVVPHSLYPDGYHCDPKQPLPFMSIASQKNHIALYHMGIYCDKKLFKWFVKEYPKHSKAKMDLGKSCLRFKKFDDIPYSLIEVLSKKVSPNEWISLYEKVIKK